MNSNTLVGEATNLTGEVKEAVGQATGNEPIQGSGVADPISGTVQNGYGKVRDFAHDRPFAATALAGLIGLALFNTLRGK